ncbi:MAG: pyrrolo-quinoline quinone [Ktedonobacteraceae bacterium]|nr:pyrrolo-quinoline quinone [Ktedonobacteraceae bacterium]
MLYRNDIYQKIYKQFHPLRSFFLLIIIIILPGTPFLRTPYPLFASTIHNAPKTGDISTNAAVVTYHNDPSRSGLNANESILTTGNVNSSQFGKRVTYPVDGQVYTQPLFLPHVRINKNIHNVVFVATEHDSVYAFDADQTVAIAPLWKTSFLSSRVTTVPAIDLFQQYSNKDISPEIGITGTPVIDPTTDILYVDTMTKENGGQYAHQLHALDIKTGSEKPGSPITIQARISGTGDGTSSGKVSFNAGIENQRSALLLSRGVVYVSWASFSDTGPYHGWLIGYIYNGRALHQVTTDVYNVTPNGQEGGIWMSGAGPAADTNGNIYFITGNGTFDLTTGGLDAGDSIIKLNTQKELSLADYFTPFNQACLSAADKDLGSGSPLLLPDQINTPHPHLMIGGGKEGRIYVINRDNMGHYINDPKLVCDTPEENLTSIDKVLQELPPYTIGRQFSTPAYWTSPDGQWVYISGMNDNLKAFQLSNDTLAPDPTSETPEIFQFPGVIPSISSNRNISDTGIVWIISPPSVCFYMGCNPYGPGILRAYDATNLGNELYNSVQNSSRDGLDSYVKFSVPTIANGKVFVGTLTGLSIYGLLNH